MRITLAQIDSGTDVGRNLELIDSYCARAAAEGSELIVFPEYSTYEKARLDRSFADNAEPLDGPVASQIHATAARHGIAVVAGLLETTGEPGRAFNTLVAVGADGSRLASYRKIHLFDCQGFRESEYIKPGPGACTRHVFPGRRGLRTNDLLRPSLPRAGAPLGRRRGAGPPRLFIVGSRHREDRAVGHFGQGASHRKRRVRGSRVPNSGGIHRKQHACGPPWHGGAAPWHGAGFRHAGGFTRRRPGRAGTVSNVEAPPAQLGAHSPSRPANSWPHQPQDAHASEGDPS